MQLWVPHIFDFLPDIFNLFSWVDSTVSDIENILKIYKLGNTHKKQKNKTKNGSKHN